MAGEDGEEQDLAAVAEEMGLNLDELQDAEALTAGLGLEEEAGEAVEEDPAAVDEELAPAEDEPVVEEEEVAAAAEDPAADEDDDGALEPLSEATEGTLRLKRLLSRDEDAPGAKKQRVGEGPRPIEQAKVRQLLTKWGLKDCAVTKHVLESFSLAELKYLLDSGYSPDKFNQWKSPSELLQNHVSMLRERVGPGGGILDPVSAFKCRWKLEAEDEQKLRKLDHKVLRYVFREYNAEKPLDDVIAEGGDSEPDESAASGVLSDAPGTSTIGRFHRLELIDPLADAAVFGDANLTFSLKLAKQRKALGHVGRVIATTFENLETLRERYKEIDDTIKQLEEHYAEVYHGVDCTRIGQNPQFQGLENSLGAVYYNFPHAGAVSGFFDGHPLVNWRHENLMRLFFRALRSFVKPGGIVKVSSNMGAVGVRYSYIIGSAVENEFCHVETMPLLEWHLRKYGRSYGDRRDAYKRPDQGQGYNVQRAEADMVYTFQYAPSGETLPKQNIRLPPTLKTIQGCTDGPFKSLIGQARMNLANQLYKRFVTEIGGTHVG